MCYCAVLPRFPAVNNLNLLMIMKRHDANKVSKLFEYRKFGDDDILAYFCRETSKNGQSQYFENSIDLGSAQNLIQTARATNSHTLGVGHI